MKCTTSSTVTPNATLGRHHRADVDQERASIKRLEERVTPAHAPKHHHGWECSGQQEHQPGRGGTAEQHHHYHNDSKVNYKSKKKSVEQEC